MNSYPGSVMEDSVKAYKKWMEENRDGYEREKAESTRKFKETMLKAMSSSCQMCSSGKMFGCPHFLAMVTQEYVPDITPGDLKDLESVLHGMPQVETSPNSKSIFSHLMDAVEKGEDPVDAAVKLQGNTGVQKMVPVHSYIGEYNGMKYYTAEPQGFVDAQDSKSVSKNCGGCYLDHKRNSFRVKSGKKFDKLKRKQEEKSQERLQIFIEEEIRLGIPYTKQDIDVRTNILIRQEEKRRQKVYSKFETRSNKRLIKLERKWGKKCEKRGVCDSCQKSFVE